MYTSKAVKILISLGLLFSLALGAVEKGDASIQPDFKSDLRYLPEMQARAADSIYLPGYGEIKVPQRDTLFSHCAGGGYEAVEDLMQHYYEDLDAIADENARREESRKMRESMKRIGGNVLQRELEYGEAIALPESTLDMFARKVSAFYALADKSAARNDPAMEMRALLYVFRKLYEKEQFHAAFLCAGRIAERLEAITDADYRDRKRAWYNLGRVYFDFRDYEHAIPYLKAALLDDVAPRYYCIYNLQARNVLGVYYREIGELDSSDYYFRSILESKDRVQMRPMHDCIALSNLATNYRKRGRYREALELHKGALPFSLADNDHSFTSGIYVGLAECYLETGDPVRCKAMIDSALYHIDLWPWVMSYRSCDLYPVMARYYARVGDQERSLAYMDSTTVANRREDEKYSALVMLRAKQELFESESARKELQLNTFRHVSVIMGVTAGIILVALIIISVLYRKKHQAYRRLAARSREWAESKPAVMPATEVDSIDRSLMESINRLFEEEQVYLDPSLDLESLSQRLGIHRNLISKAVNAVYGKPFSSFVNECRVREAILLLSDPANDARSLEAVSFDAGFSTRQTFYRVFKAQTGINPATYRKNREALADN